jgi:hypothetical protein
MRGLLIPIFIAVIYLIACTARTEESDAAHERECIEVILATDDSLGQLRNNASKTMPLSTVIRGYVHDLKQLETHGCPDDFVVAVDAHRAAWIGMLDITDKYPDLRGEMHVLFDSIAAGRDSTGYKIRLQAVWDTWEVVLEEARLLIPGEDEEMTELLYTLPEHIDHLVYVVPDLQDGIDQIEQLLGVRPVIGGRHPTYGTHNALIALGPSTYLEIIARDETLDQPSSGSLFGTDYVAEPHLVTWALRTDSIEKLRHEAVEAGFQIGEVSSGSRETPDGTVLSWHLTDPYAMPFDGIVPFLIDWGDTPHPAVSIPQGGTLLDLHIRHPEHEEVRSALAALDVHVPVECNPEFQLIATIQTSDGPVELY